MCILRVCGVVCEYNPFHNGHKYQIDYIKNKLGFDAVVGVMSGSFTSAETRQFLIKIFALKRQC